MDDMFWILGLIVVGLLILYVYVDHQKKTKAHKQLFDMAHSVNAGIFPNGKEDQEEGAMIVHEFIDRKMSLDECREIFIKAAIFSNISDDVKGHLERRYGNRLTGDDVERIIGFLAFRKVMIAMGKPVKFVMDPESGRVLCQDREPSAFQ